MKQCGEYISYLLGRLGFIEFDLCRLKMRLSIVIFIIFLHFPANASSNLSLSGTLLEEPCRISVEDSSVELDFGSIINKLLYSNHRTGSVPFKIHLSGCDSSLSSYVNIKFTGQEDPSQTGMLFLEATSDAKGIALGIEGVDGVPVEINKDIVSVKINDGENNIVIMAYISASAEAITEKRIIPGSINAMMFFSLEYF